MKNNSKNYISVGKILNFHGVQGEAKVGYSKNQTDFLKQLKSAYIFYQNEYVEFKVKYVKFNNKNAIFKFDGINSINDILLYKNCLIYVPQVEFTETLGDDEYLVEDLVGMDVMSADKKVGVIVGISNNGATDLLSVRGLSKKISLIPFVNDLVPEVDLVNKKIYINEIQGLID